MSRLLVTDGELRAALAAVRALGTRHAVFVTSDVVRSLAGRSRFADAEARVPAALQDPAGFRAAIADLVARESIDVVVPVSDAACRALLADPGGLGRARLAAPDRKAYERLSHKGEMAALARVHGVAVPDGAEASSVEAACAVARGLGYPVILKPVLSVDDGPAAGYRKRGVAVAPDEAALRRLWNENVGTSAALVQTMVPGTGEGLFLLRWEGRTRAALAHRRLREKPPAGGVSTLSESIAVDPQLLRQVEAMLDTCGFSGVAMAEFRSDGRTRWLMEFNARLWGSLQLALDAGVDFPSLHVDAVLGAPAAPPPGYRTGVRSRWLLGDLDHALALARGAQDGFGRTGLRRALAVMLGPAGPDCRWENPRRGDLHPFGVELRAWAHALRR